MSGLSNLIKRINRWLAPAAVSEGATTTTPQPTALGANLAVEEIEEEERSEEPPEEQKTT